MTSMFPSPTIRSLVGLSLAILGSIWTFISTPMICADPGGCGLHIELWDPLTWSLVLTGLAAVIVGLVLLTQGILRSRPP